MSLSNDAVKNIARLARIQIRDEDIPSIAADMSNVFALAAQLNSVNTDNIEPLAHPLLDVPARLRADAITEHCEDGQLQSLTTFVEEHLYLVPSVLEE